MNANNELALERQPDRMLLKGSDRVNEKNDHKTHFKLDAPHRPGL